MILLKDLIRVSLCSQLPRPCPVALYARQALGPANTWRFTRHALLHTSQACPAYKSPKLTSVKHRSPREGLTSRHQHSSDCRYSVCILVWLYDGLCSMLLLLSTLQALQDSRVECSSCIPVTAALFLSLAAWMQDVPGDSSCPLFGALCLRPQPHAGRKLPFGPACLQQASARLPLHRVEKYSASSCLP